MKKILLLLVLVLVLVIGFKNSFIKGNSHTNSRYGFKFSYDNATKLERNGSFWDSCKRYECVDFIGCVKIGHNAIYQENYGNLGVSQENINVDYIGRTEEVGQGSKIIGIATYSPLSLFSEYKFKDGKVYKIYGNDLTIDTVLKNTDPKYQLNLTKEELLANETVQKYLERESEATPFLVNKNGVVFYEASLDSSSFEYCTFKEVGGEKKAMIICFYQKDQSFEKNITIRIPSLRTRNFSL